jgi:hypothetical protein
MGTNRVKWKQRLNAGFESAAGETPERGSRSVDGLRKFREPPLPNGLGSDGRAERSGEKPSRFRYLRFR